MHDIDHALWKGDRSEALFVQYISGDKSRKEVRPKGVVGWTHGDGPAARFLCSVIVVLMQLRILSKLETTVIVLIDGQACYYLAWAEVPPPNNGEGGRELRKKTTRESSFTVILMGTV